MKFACNGTQLFIIIEDKLEWFMLRDATGDGSLEIDIDATNFDVFFPEWEEYVNPIDIFGTLHNDDAFRFETLEVIFRNGVTDEGEGEYGIEKIELVTPNYPPEDIDPEFADDTYSVEDCDGIAQVTLHLNPPAPEV